MKKFTKIEINFTKDCLPKLEELKEIGETLFELQRKYPFIAGFDLVKDRRAKKI